MTIYSPFNIRLLLHCHISPEPYPEVETSGAIRATMKELVEIGAIEPDTLGRANVYQTTPLGKAWVQALCNVPPPKAAFVDEQGRVL